MNLTKHNPLLIGHSIVINSIHKLHNSYPTISIYGLGSCIALILYDKENPLYGMSHILLPSSERKSEIKFPHKYADLSEMDVAKLRALENEMKGKILLAYKEMKPAQLTEEQTNKVRMLEKELGVVIVAYE